MLHVDVMDGHFVPNITIGPPVVKAVRRSCGLPIDCHLMIDDPDRYLSAFAEAGADMISVHAEACRHLHRTVHAIKSMGCKAGVALNPATPVAAVLTILEDLDFVLLMTVNPGFGGQRFISAVVPKIVELRRIAEQRHPELAIEVDGGVTLENAQHLYQSGADWLVAGTAIFAQPEYSPVIARFRAQVAAPASSGSDGA